MILEDGTHEAFNHYASELKPHSNKLIIAACEVCGEFKVTTKNHYHTFCNSCSCVLGGKNKGETFTDEHKAKLSAAKEGEKNFMFGKEHTEETKAKISTSLKGEKCPNFGKRGKDASHYTGGKELAEKRHSAKRRQLGFIALNSYFKGSEGHHITHNYVIYVPKPLHRSVYHNLNTNQGMEEITALALKFMINGF